jgi:CRISPR-associated protein Csd1
VIIQSLIDYYDRLAASGDERVAAKGYSWQKIGFAVVLELDGRFHAIEDRRQEVYPSATKKKPNPKPLLISRPMLVPGQAKPSGSGLNPNFLWDQPGYLVGYKPDDQKPERTSEACTAFREKHIALEPAINAPEFSAVCRFLSTWEPSKLSDVARKQIDQGKGGFGIFQIRGQKRYVHEVPAVRSYWAAQGSGGDARPIVPSLVSGELAQAAVLHEPKIKGVRGANPGGAPLVGFNLPAFGSFGFEQGENAPMSDWEAFRYCSALNTLTSSQRANVDGSTFVYWTGQPSAVESFLGFIFAQPPEDNALKEKLRVTLAAIVQGRNVPELGELAVTFYALGLAGNVGRIAVKSWHESTLETLYARLKEHFTALEIEREWPDSQPEFPSNWQLLKSTIRRGKPGEKDEEIKPGQAEGLLRAILDGTHYPISIFTAVLRRMRVEGQVGYLRAAIIKAVLTRNYGIKIMQDEETQETGYRLGRLLAVLERLQYAAIASAPLNSFFGAASTTPRMVFPRLIKGAQPHLAKLRAQGKVGLTIWYEKLIQEIVEPLESYPARLTLTDQGQFGLGYYHQLRAFYAKAPEEALVQAVAA